VASAIDKTGLLQHRERIAQLREPASQTATGRVTDSHVLDHLGRMDTALLQIDDRLVIALQLNAVKINDRIQQRHQPARLPQQRQGLREVHVVIEFGEANHITAAAAAIAIEQALVGI
jgi:hypothetical protein